MSGAQIPQDGPLAAGTGRPPGAEKHRRWPLRGGPLRGERPRDERLVAAVHRQPLLLVATAGCLGIVASAWLSGWAPLGWAGLVCAALLISSRLPNGGRWIAAAVMFSPLFAMRFAQDQKSFHDASILALASERPSPVVLAGIIDRPIVLRRHPLAEQVIRRGQSAWQTQLEMSIHGNRIEDQFESCSGRVLVVCSGRLDQLRPGDRLQVFGSLSQFGRPTNPGQRDLREVYRLRHLHARVDVDSPEQIIATGQPMGDPLRWIASIAAHSRELLMRHTGKESGPLAVALVVGQREYVDNQTRDLLLVTGTAHLLSVSGLHLAIVVLLARWLAALLPLPWQAKLIFVLAVCLLYTAITGARPPVVRAAVLVIAVMVSIGLRRGSQPINTLGLAAILLVAYNPMLVFSVGTQLSFLAVATLLTCGRPLCEGTAALQETIAIEQRLQSLIDQSSARPIRWLRLAVSSILQLLWMSLCVTAVSLPLVWYHFHVVAPISVVSNVVLGPMLMVALSSGVATVVLAWIWDPLAMLPGLLCHYSLLAMRWVIELAASIPAGHFWLPSPPAALVVTFYIGLAISLYWSGRRATIVRVTWIIGWLLFSMLVATRPAPLPEGTIEATFVDVGHGTSVVLRLDENEVWLYDCGRLGNDLGSSRDIDATLWSLGITRLQGVMLSHADADHYNALPGILRRFSVGQIITPPGMLSENESGLAVVRDAIERSGVVVVERYSGQVIGPLARSWDQPNAGAPLAQQGRIGVLHPPSERLAGSDNANSLVLRVDHGGTTLLLPGDLEPPGTARVIELPRPPAGAVLMAPHHGSLAMDTEPILQWSRPRETIVSGGRRARRPEVGQVLAVTGSGVHVTATVGAIRVRIDGRGQIEVDSWLVSPW